VILDALENLMEGRTSFMIAHRLSTVRNATLILVMNHGEVVEQGTHDELLARGGLYYQLYEAQTGRAAAIEAQYAQQALADGDSRLGVSDVLAEVATAEALARYEQTNPRAPEPQAPDPAPNGHGNGPEPARRPGLHAPAVPQPNQHAATPPAPAPPAPAPPAAAPPAAAAPATPAAPAAPVPPASDGEPPAAVPEDRVEVSERVVEMLTDAVRQRIRQALSDSTSGGTAEHGKGDTVPDDGTEGSNGARDQDGPGSDPPGSSPF
jgi:hypothetical protein